LEPRKAPGKRPKLEEKARKLLAKDLQQRPWATHAQRAEFLFAVSGGFFGERSEGLPSGRTPAQEPKKRSRGAAERDEFLRALWRMEVGCLDPGQLVFVEEMGTHTSLWLPSTLTRP
jgi:hypothetical protein